jgi:hypothetical protein
MMRYPDGSCIVCGAVEKRTGDTNTTQPSQAELDFINFIKAKGEVLGSLCAAMASEPSTDKRWLAIGKTHLQQGIMALVRAVAKPTTF